MQRHIGLDAHVASCTFGVISKRGRRLKSGVVETNGRALVEFVKTVPGRNRLCLEEGTQSGWLYEVLSPHVDEIVATHIHRECRGRNDDLTDAFARAEELRMGSVTPVFKDAGRMGPLRARVDVHEQVTRDVVRVQNPQSVEELAAEQLAEHTHGKEETRSRGAPLPALVEAAARHDAV